VYRRRGWLVRCSGRRRWREWNAFTGESGGGGGAGWYGGGGCGQTTDAGGGGGGGTSYAAPSVTDPSFSLATAGRTPSVTLVYTAGLEVTTTSLPDGTASTSYDQTLAAANGPIASS
jgi:hypothetical protein